MPGPPPKPTELKRLAGNPGHQKLPVPAVVIEGAIDHVPDPPAHLGAPGRARWEEVWSVADKWLIAQLDMGILARYCEGFDTRATLKARIKRDGIMTRGSVGQPRVNPAYMALTDLDAQLTRWESELGFTPAGRARLHVEKRPKPQQRAIDKYIRTG